MNTTRQASPPPYVDRHPLDLFGGYALLVVGMVAPASSGSGFGVAGAALLLAAVIGAASAGKAAERDQDGEQAPDEG